MTKKQYSMVSANIKIIEDLKYFLDSVSTDAAIRKLVIQADGDLSRNRKLPLSKLVGLIINMPKRSLSIEIQDFFECLEQETSVTKGAFSL